MALPPNWAAITVKGEYLDLNGAPLTGKKITFTLNGDASAAVSHTTIPGNLTVTGTIDTTGQLKAYDGTTYTDLILPSTNDPDVTPAGLAYQVNQTFGTNSVYAVVIPYDAPSGICYLPDLVPLVNPSELVRYVTPAELLAATNVISYAHLRAGGSGPVATGPQIWMDATNYNINTMPIVISYPDMLDGESSKGGYIEHGFNTPGDGGPLEWGIATREYDLWAAAGSVLPKPTFMIPVGQRGEYVHATWIGAHYDSPSSTGEDVHQHLNFETVKADWSTVVTRLQISFGEDVALITFPNSEVRILSQQNFFVGSRAQGLRLMHNTSTGRIEAETPLPINMMRDMGIRIGDAGSPNGRMDLRITGSETTTDKPLLNGQNLTTTAMTQAMIELVGGLATNGVIRTKIPADTVSRYKMDISGKMEWGPGNGARDTFLYRNAAGDLKTDGQLSVGGKTVLAGVSVPGSATATGVAGQVTWDANYVYVCTATNTWKRSALATW